ncbi:hypothetical protein PENTCL1PPCAC_22722 [Pristionchus entomophagus]|uniref:G protein-coupled receptor n=1 Tax=Pristionchus entomophagus TaxID=358040 RepID=A0AAV5U2F9_9BILA|nr:hypothetical protein PENTCL1PPCAC_22722 [Pristionchus entomophagus]
MCHWSSFQHPHSGCSSSSINAFQCLHHFLILIAFCDATVMAMSLVYHSVGFCHPIYNTRGWIIFTKVFGITTVLIHSASLWLTVNMAILRYCLLSGGSSSSPSSSSFFSSCFSNLPSPNTMSAAILAIISALIVSIIGSLLNSNRYEIEEDGLLSPIHSNCIGHHEWKEGDLIRKYGIRQPHWWNCTMNAPIFG